MRKMKDSGVEWIGEMPSDWALVRVKNQYSSHKYIVGNDADNYERLALTLNGVIRRSKEDSNGLQPEAFDGYQVLNAGELVFKLIDLANVSTSRVGYSPYTGIVSPAYIILNPIQNTVAKYGEKFFLSMWQREVFNHMGDDGVRSSLNVADLLNVPYPLPPIQDQQRIADFLDRKCADIDNVLEKTRASIEEYKKLKHSVITKAVTKGIRGERPMKDSGVEWIGKFPCDWMVPKISYLAFIASGGTPDRNNLEYWNNGTINWIKTGELQNNILMTSEEKITECAISQSSAKVFDKGTVLVAMYGQGKTRGMTAYLGVPCTTNQACAALTIKENIVLDKYLWKCLIGAYDALRDLAMGTGQPNLNLELISNFKVPLPPLEEQQEIVSYLDKKCPEIDSLIESKERFITELEAYRKSLIYEYVTGKKEVPNC